MNRWRMGLLLVPMALAWACGDAVDEPGEQALAEAQASSGEEALEAEEAAARGGACGPLQLVDDLEVADSSSAPDHLTRLRDGTIVFSASDPDHGVELWRSDGTPEGTRLIKDLNPGMASSNPHHFFVWNGTLFFSARTDRARLWRSDGTPQGTVPIAEVSTGDSPAPSFAPFRGALYFGGVAPDGTSGLWRTDGTPGGTREVQRLGPDPYELATDLLVVGRTLYFTSNRIELWKTDGTATGGVLLKPMPEGYLTGIYSPLTALNGKVYFAGLERSTGDELWVSDGTPEGTRIVVDLSPGEEGSYPRYLVATNGRLFFRARSPSTGFEPWSSDGTAAGTRLIKDIVPGVADSFPEVFTVMGRQVYFTAVDELGRELWRTDGRPGGTVRVKDIDPGADSAFNSDGEPLTVIDGQLWFSADDGVHGFELWVSDGTARGTRQVQDLGPGERGSNPSGFVRADDEIFFSADDGATGRELYRFAPRARGASAQALVRDIHRGTGSSNPTSLTELDGRMYFLAGDSAHGRELWRSDGTARGTALVEDIHPGPATGTPESLVKADGRLFFFADDGVHGLEPWTSDGTAAGTYLLRDVFSGPEGSRAFSPLVPWRDRVYFVPFTEDDQTSLVLWQTDGTTAGTRPVFTRAQHDVLVTQLGPVEDLLYFASRGSELWKTDGTEAGTVFVTNIPAREGWSASILGMAEVNGALLFVVAISADFGPVSEYSLWRSDGTAEGTVALAPLWRGYELPAPSRLTVVGDLLFFVQERHYRDTRPARLWRSDGTSAGTFELPADVGPEYDFPGATAAVGHRLFFAGHDDAHGWELWVTDGTAAGTRLVRDIVPGPEGSRAAELAEVDGVLWFTANDGRRGFELWRSDGGPGGTRMIRDLAEGRRSASPHGFTVASGRVFFSANAQCTGFELQALPLSIGTW